MRFDAGIFWHLLFSTAFLKPAWITVWATFISMAIGVTIGLVGGLAATSSLAMVRGAVRVYVMIFRGLPTLVQIVFWYDALSELTNGFVNLPALTAGILALGVNEGAYMTEIVRAGLASVDRGQREASTALGLSPWQAQRFVVIPQALRVIVPPTGNQVISMLKTTSLLFTIGVQEIFATGTNIYSVNFQYFEVLSVVSIWYLGLTGLLTLVQRRLERHFGARWTVTESGRRGVMSRMIGFGGPMQ